MREAGGRSRAWARMLRASGAIGLALALLANPARGAEARGEMKLRVLVAADEDPEMFSFDAGSAPGLEREMIESFARLHGLKVDAVPIVNFEDIIPALNGRQGDVILGIVETEGRRAQVSFTHEVLPTRHVVVTLAGRGPLRSLDELKTRKVGVVTGSTWAEAALEAGVPAGRVASFVDQRDMTRALLAGQVNAVVMGITSFALAQKRHPELRVSLFLGAPGRHAWAVRKSDTALRGLLDRHIAMLKGSAAWSHLLARYLSPESLALFASARKP
ncbi:MAG TPA: ABC transporter substrate-binding protein [Vicinamibacteria bacterium]|nr:ABC transporter substrate-binding protein [Vicinamibacteria bacterium]